MSTERVKEEKPRRNGNVKSSAVINNNDFGPSTEEGNNSTAHGTIGARKADGIDSS